MNRLGLGLGMMLGALAITPAAATVVFTGNTATLTSASVGTAFAVRYDGLVNNNVQSGLKSSALITLSSISTTGRIWSFAITLANQSVAPMISARITGFGMGLQGFAANNAQVAITGAAAAAAGNNPLIFGQVLRQRDLGGNINVPQLGQIADVCFMAGSGTGNNCSGGGNGGLDMGNPFPMTSQVFTLSFAKSISQLNLSDMFVRYQSLDGSRFGTSGVGRGTFDPGGGIDPGGNPVPEPATWAMLIAGFGLVGAAARRQRLVRA